jgi:hypothetical protein
MILHSNTGAHGSAARVAAHSPKIFGGSKERSYLTPFASNRVSTRTPSVGWARPIYCFCRSAVAWSSARLFICSLVLCLVGSCLLVQTRVAFFGGGTGSKRDSFLVHFFLLIFKYLVKVNNVQIRKCFNFSYV